MNKNDPQYEDAYNDWKDGMKYKEIAEKYGISLSAVKSWATRDWKLRKGRSKQKKSCNQKERKVATNGKKKVDRKGIGGAPPRNQNSIKHGLYSGVYWDVLSDEEKDMLQDMNFSDEEAQLKEQLAMLTIREHRLMKQLNRLRELSNTGRANNLGMYISNVEKQKGVYGGITAKVDLASTSMASVQPLIVRFESELTKVQKQKAKCIEQLAKIRDDKARCAREEEESQRKRDAASEGKPDSNAPVVQIVLPDNGRDRK